MQVYSLHTMRSWVAKWLILTISFLSSQTAFSLVWNMPPDAFITSGVGFFSIDLAADPFGNAFTVSGRGPITVSRFSNADQAYGPLVELAPSGSSVSVATDASQTALVIWHDRDTEEILASFYDGVSWGATTFLDTVTSSFLRENTVEVAMDGNGNGVAIWNSYNASNADGDIIVSFFDGGTQSWSSPQTINTTPGLVPQVDYSSNGTATAVWLDAANNLYASNFNGVTWSSEIGPLGTNVANNPSFTTLITGEGVQMDDAGNALVMWRDLSNNVVFNYFNGTTWGTETIIGTGADYFGAHSFALAPTGTAIAVWSAGNVGMYAEFNGTTWSAPLPFAADVNPGSTSSVAVDSAGNALIVYQTADATLSIYKPFGGPLGTPDLVGADPDDFLPLVSALSDNGRGFADGTIFLTESNILYRTFTLLFPPPPPPPTDVSGEVCVNRFASQTDRVHIISWTPSSDPTVTAYLLMRDGQILAVVPATGPFVYFDHNRCKGRPDAYTVVAISPGGASISNTVILR